MKTIRLVVGSILVYLIVATVYACAPSMSPTGGTGGMATGGGRSTGGSTGAVAPAMADESGSRIEVVYLIGDDGSKIMPSYYDTTRKEYCDAYAASDGRRHCMPALGSNSIVGGVYFSDSGCTATVASSLVCYGAPKYVIANVAQSSCAPFYRVYNAGPAVGAGSTIYVGNPGSCSTIPQAPATAYYSLGAEIQPSAFVGYTPQTP